MTSNTIASARSGIAFGKTERLRVLTAVLVTAAAMLLPCFTHAQDMREAVRRAEQEKRKTEQRAREVEQETFNDRNKLLAKVGELEQRRDERNAKVTTREAQLRSESDKQYMLLAIWEKKSL